METTKTTEQDDRIAYGRAHNLIEQDGAVVILDDGRILTDNYSGVGLTLLDWCDSYEPTDYHLDHAIGSTDYKVCAANIIDAVWVYSGPILDGTDLSAVINTLAMKLGGEAQEWRTQIIQALCQLSHTDSPACNRGTYNTELCDGGVYTTEDGDEIAWWHNGAETRWMLLDDCDDDERAQVGAAGEE